MNIKSYNYSYNRICAKCVMDDTVKGIVFDENGFCPYCKIHDKMETKFPFNNESSRKLQDIINKIKKDGRKNKYDCIVGISGGRDSTYTLYNAVKYGLRPLAVHVDNGWNSEKASQNVKLICDKLNVDLYTYIVKWDEFRDLQRSFLLASVPDAEVPTDWIIYSVLFQIASLVKVKYIIHGHSFRTEGTAPISWTYMDGRYVKYVQKRYGTKKLKNIPNMSMKKFIFFSIIKRIKQIRILYYIPYNEHEILTHLSKEIGWRDYGGKHHESMYTAFIQSYVLPRKFNIDKRKLHYSALIRSGQLRRKDALEKLKEDPYSGGVATIEYCLKKIGIGHDEFEDLMSAPIKSFVDYKSYYSLIKMIKTPMKWGNIIGIIPDSVFLKYFDIGKSL